MNKATYEALEAELNELNREAITTHAMMGRIKDIEEMIAPYFHINETADCLLWEDLNDEDTLTLQWAIKLCEYLTNEDEEELRDHHFSIPIGADFDNEDDYPIGETLLLLRWPNSTVVTFIKTDDDEYTRVYTYLDI